MHIHPTDSGSMAISPNNGSFLVNMAEPIVHFTVVALDPGNQYRRPKMGVFFISIITASDHPAPTISNLYKHLQGISYLEHLSDIAGKPNPTCSYTVQHNIEVHGMRMKYYTNIQDEITKLIQTEIEEFQAKQGEFL